jgi:ribonuclease P protein component
VRKQAWLGAMVPKRWARRSVTRHTIKRQIYAVSSDYEDALLCASYVVRLRSGFDRKQFVSATSDHSRRRSARNCNSFLRPGRAA